jgi:hypothetical protein
MTAVIRRSSPAVCEAISRVRAQRACRGVTAGIRGVSLSRLAESDVSERIPPHGGDYSPIGRAQSQAEIGWRGRPRMTAVMARSGLKADARGHDTTTSRIRRPRLQPRAIPRDLGVTRACALACVHCRADAIHRRDPRELTTDEACRLIDQVRGFGEKPPLFVLICGGSRSRAFAATGATMASDPLCAYEPGPGVEPLVAAVRPVPAAVTQSGSSSEAS